MSKQTIASWQLLHQHYTKVKLEHQLYTCDIIRQLGGKNYHSFINYLSPEGIDRTPSNRENTVGRTMRDLLTSGLNKTDWLPSTASYVDKLSEMSIDHCYMNVHVLNEEACKQGAIPELEVDLCMDEGVMISKPVLASMFTIDGIVPNIVNVGKSYQLVLRENYTPIGDR